MRTRKRTEITVETRRVLVVRQPCRQARIWCAECDPPAEMITVEEAGAAAGLSQRAIFRLAEADRLHSTETTDGRLFVCLYSLRR